MHPSHLLVVGPHMTNQPGSDRANRPVCNNVLGFLVLNVRFQEPQLLVRMYFHLSEIKVQAGQVIDAEEVKGKKVHRVKVGGWSQSRYQRLVGNAHQEHAKELIERLNLGIVREPHPHLCGPARAHALLCPRRSQSHLLPLWMSLLRGWWLSSPPRSPAQVARGYSAIPGLEDDPATERSGITW